MEMQAVGHSQAIENMRVVQIATPDYSEIPEISGSNRARLEERWHEVGGDLTAAQFVKCMERFTTEMRLALSELVLVYL
jgi:hypothetical protein